MMEASRDQVCREGQEVATCLGDCSLRSINDISDSSVIERGIARYVKLDERSRLGMDADMGRQTRDGMAA